MKKLITYIFLLLALISLVHITKEVVSFSKDIIILKEYQTEAIVKQEKMLHPVVKISNIEQNVRFSNSVQDTAITVDAVVSTATGFSIQYDPMSDISFIVTNDHFCRSIESESSLVIENHEQSTFGLSEDYLLGRVLYTDSGLDLCLIGAFGYIAPATIADYDYNPEIFEKVFIVGGPTGNFPIIIDTYVSSYVEREEVMLGDLDPEGNEFMIVSEQIFSGHSGSPIFNQEGEVVGIVFASMETYGGISISHRDIFKLLIGHKNNF